MPIHHDTDAETALLHLLAAADEEYLAHLAAEAGICVESLRQALNTPRRELTCPLCGQAATHLLTCRGCGPDAWGDEFQLLWGEMAPGDLRQALAGTLGRGCCDPDAVAAALPRAYAAGGCLLCPTCWSQTWPRYIARSCPLLLLAERHLEGPGAMPDDYYLASLHGVSRQEWEEKLRERWVCAEKEEVRGWRKAIGS